MGDEERRLSSFEGVMKDKRHPAAKARDEWLDSEEGRKWARLIAAGAAKESALMAAFDAGYRAGLISLSTAERLRGNLDEAPESVKKALRVASDAFSED